MRGLLPSLGAGASLIAAALCALAVFGGMLAFRGDSRGPAEASAGELTLPAGKVRARTGPGATARAPLAARTSAVASRAAARPPAPRPARAVVRTRARRAPQAPAITPTVTAPPQRAPTPSVTAPRRATPPQRTPTPSPVTAAGEPARDVPVIGRSVPPPSGTVQRAITRTRALAQPVIDAAPAPVRAPVDQVAATVDDVTGALLP